MTLYDTPNLTSGIDDALVDVATSVPILIPLLLFFVFTIVLMGGMNRQKARTGSADMPMWASIASLSTLTIALGLTLTEGLIDLTTLAIVVVITVLSGLWLFLSRNKNEIV
jgi:hypothetical protein